MSLVRKRRCRHDGQRSTGNTSIIENWRRIEVIEKRLSKIRQKCCVNNIDPATELIERELEMLEAIQPSKLIHPSLVKQNDRLRSIESRAVSLEREGGIS